MSIVMFSIDSVTHQRSQFSFWKQLFKVWLWRIVNKINCRFFSEQCRISNGGRERLVLESSRNELHGLSRWLKQGGEMYHQGVVIHFKMVYYQITRDRLILLLLCVCVYICACVCISFYTFYTYCVNIGLHDCSLKV